MENRYFTSELEQSLVSIVDLLDWDNFHIGGEVVLSTEIEHLLGFADAANVRAGEITIAHDKAKGNYTERFRRRADDRKIAVAGEQVEICIDIVIGRDRVENEIKAAGMFHHFVSIPRNYRFVRP